MTDQIPFDHLIDEVRRIYRSGVPQAESEIEAFLGKSLQGLTFDERLAFLDRLIAGFGSPDSSPGGVMGSEDEVLSKVFSLLLGRKVSKADLSSSELLERLAASLNTIFDSLNQLVSVINSTLSWQGTGEETIRQVIGVHLEGEDQTKSLEDYLGQIKEAFLVTQQAFKKAAYDKVEQILSELDPKVISEAGSGGFKFGALRKAEFFDTYEERYNKIRKWFESGRFIEELLREFEKKSQQLSALK
ncbi:MAG: hypothetical protein BBJ60_09370 [Desulfobacterales bacterium S7086C20]|nr:MAG: hypothetical protein BBJ60_09370 [Desulfobacterales bacterium S7086C20]